MEVLTLLLAWGCRGRMNFARLLKLRVNSCWLWTWLLISRRALLVNISWSKAPPRFGAGLCYSYVRLCRVIILGLACGT